MDRASSLIYPGSRTIAGWWRQLQPNQPKALWIGYAFLHRIEAPLHLVRAQPVEPLVHLVLRAISLEQAIAPGPVAMHSLEARLRLPDAMTRGILHGMQKTGLVAGSGDAWQMTERGRQALAQRSYPERVTERRIFPFLERLDAGGTRAAPAQFVPIAECANVHWPVGDDHRFDVAWLKACIAQPESWKQAVGFPLEIEALATGATGTADWQQVVVDRPERALLIVMQTAANEVLGFAVKVDGWVLHDRVPVLRVAAGADAADLAPSPPAAEWQEAWRDWCRQKQLPAGEVESCTLTYAAPRLEVSAPPRLVQRLQAAKSDLFKGDAWLLVGDGFVRSAMQLSLRPQR